MPAVLWLRLDAPLLSFGSTTIDHLGRTQAFPGLSWLTGLLGNALGYHHRDHDKLQSLQSRLVYAVREDRAGQSLTDFQTVDLGQPFLVDVGWTTDGVVEARGGSSSTGTHIRQREFLADAVYTVALALRDESAKPTLADVARALDFPARPIYLGRKPCLPASRLLLGLGEAESLLAALRAAPAAAVGRRRDGVLRAWWPDAEEEPTGMLVHVVDERDWANQIHVGQRTVRYGHLKETAHA